ncbi:hypothetical protein IJT93_12225 [bacterium]|nr:hypothetical protein [bacterium]
MRRSGFTLLEITIVMGLAILVYSLIAYITVQMNVSVRHTEAGYKRKKETIEAAELLRWQLRCLYAEVPEGANVKTVPASRIHPAALKNAFFYGKRGTQTDRAFLTFKTTYFPKGFANPGAAEVSFTILEDSSGRVDEDRLNSFIDSSFEKGAVNGDGSAKAKSRPEKTLAGVQNSENSGVYLAYRQFPWADPLGLHEEADLSEAPWQVLSYEVIGINAEYSDDAEIWQQEWTSPRTVPKWIKITFILRTGEPLVFIAAPAAKSARW